MTSNSAYKTTCGKCGESLSLANRDAVTCAVNAGGCGRLCHNRCEKLERVEKDSISFYICESCSDKSVAVTSDILSSVTTQMVYSPILSFVNHCVHTGIGDDNCVATCSDFYKVDELESARSLLVAVVKPTSKFSSRRGLSAKKHLCEDIIGILRSEDASPRSVLPKFVMTASDVIPTIESEVHANMTRAIHSWDKRLMNYADKLDFIASKVSEAPELLKNCCAELGDKIGEVPSRMTNGNVIGSGNVNWPSLAGDSDIVGVVVDSPPAEADDPVKRHEVLKNLIGSEGIVRVTVPNNSNQGSKWVIHAKKSSAEVLKNSLTQKFGNSEIKKTRIIGLLPSAKFSFDVNEVAASNDGIEGFERIGSSSSYRVLFRSVSAKSYYLRHGIHIGYEHFRIKDYQFLPKMCFKCGSLDHVATACSSVERCLKCLDTDHSHSRTNPCTNSSKCVHCGSTDHTGFSFRCKVIADRIKKAKK